MLGFGIAANENAPIIAASAHVKVRRTACTGVFGNRVIPARRREAHLKTQLTALPLGRIWLPGRVGKAYEKLLIIFGAHAMANKHNHARQAFGALIDGGLTTPAKQICSIRKGRAPELYNVTPQTRSLLSGLELR